VASMTDPWCSRTKASATERVDLRRVVESACRSKYSRPSNPSATTFFVAGFVVTKEFRESFRFDMWHAPTG
jgi:hypothetical protein